MLVFVAFCFSILDLSWLTIELLIIVLLCSIVCSHNYNNNIICSVLRVICVLLVYNYIFGSTFWLHTAQLSRYSLWHFVGLLYENNDGGKGNIYEAVCNMFVTLYHYIFGNKFRQDSHCDTLHDYNNYCMKTIVGVKGIWGHVCNTIQEAQDMHCDTLVD